MPQPDGCVSAPHRDHGIPGLAEERQLEQVPVVHDRSLCERHGAVV